MVFHSKHILYISIFYEFSFSVLITADVLGQYKSYFIVDLFQVIS